MVLYFTGTGNSRYLARRIAEGLDMPLYDLNACIKAGDTAPVQTGRDVVLVTPTYAWRIPRVVSEWLGKTALTGAERLWFVMDCGSEIGNAAGYNRQLAAQKQLQYMGTAQIIMPENYIAMFNAPQKEQARSIVEQAEPALQKVLTQLKAGQEFPPPRDNLYDRFMSGPVNPVFYRFFVKADAFRATDACIGCGKCVELCPLNNIHLENGKPVWGKNCTHCMACICYCPKEAIEVRRNFYVAEYFADFNGWDVHGVALSEVQAAEPAGDAGNRHGSGTLRPEPAGRQHSGHLPGAAEDRSDHYSHPCRAGAGYFRAEKAGAACCYDVLCSGIL